MNGSQSSLDEMQPSSEEGKRNFWAKTDQKMFEDGLALEHFKSARWAILSTSSLKYLSNILG